MPYENLLYEKRDRIGFITFNRPKVLNALNRKTMEELNQILIAAREDEDVRVLLLTGAGEKSFVAGADISELAVQNPGERKRHGAVWSERPAPAGNAGKTLYRGDQRFRARRRM